MEAAEGEVREEHIGGVSGGTDGGRGRRRKERRIITSRQENNQLRQYIEV